MQGGGSLPLNLGRTPSAIPTAPIVARPQDPKDFPYKQEDVVFTNPKAGDPIGRYFNDAIEWQSNQDRDTHHRFGDRKTATKS